MTIKTGKILAEKAAEWINDQPAMVYARRECADGERIYLEYNLSTEEPWWVVRVGAANIIYSGNLESAVEVFNEHAY